MSSLSPVLVFIARYWIFVAFYFFYAKQLLVLAKNAATFKPHLATINIMLDYNPLICFVLYLIGTLILLPNHLILCS